MNKLLTSQRLWFVVILLLILIARSVLIDWYRVPTGSMNPTILEGDIILVNKLAWGLRIPFTGVYISRWGAPERGDIVIVANPEQGPRLVKRVIGLPGERLRITGGRVRIDDEPVQYRPASAAGFPELDAAMLATRTLMSERLPGRAHAVVFGPQQRLPPVRGDYLVPDGQYFLLGDHRGNSRDSRYFGAVDQDMILGRAFRVAISLDTENGWQWRGKRLLLKLQ